MRLGSVGTRDHPDVLLAEAGGEQLDTELPGDQLPADPGLGLEGVAEVRARLIVEPDDQLTTLHSRALLRQQHVREGSAVGGEQEPATGPENARQLPQPIVLVGLSEVREDRERVY